MEYVITFFSNMNFTNNESIALIFLFLMFIGFISLGKDIIKKFPSVTRKPRLLQVLITIIAFLAVIFVIYRAVMRFPEINSNDMGIILQIVGFVIYLPSIRRFLSCLVGEDNQLKTNDQTIKTTAISLIVIGLLLQLSFGI